MSQLRRKALQMLARREHSRAELGRKLAPLGSTEEVEAVLVDLEGRQLLSDARVAEAYLRRQGMRLGAARLRQGLLAKGVDGSLIGEQVAGAGLATEIERARALRERKFGNPPANRQEWARQARFLQTRGFSVDIVCRLLKDFE